MNLLQRILECEENELDSIIREAIKDADSKSRKVEKLGFLNIMEGNTVFNGFIPLDTRIKYSSLNLEDYGMQTTDFFFEFARFIRTNNINSKVSLIFNLEYFINNYFGYIGKTSRETIFKEIAWKTTTTDEEFFAKLKNNKIGDLKGKGAAECTERGALAQQILSFFGVEVYYCIGCVHVGDRQEAHCFNIVKRKDDYALLDYSIPITSFDQNGKARAYYPFVGVLTNEEFTDFIQNGTIKSFDNYQMSGKDKVLTGDKRRYIVGEFDFTKEEIDVSTIK